MLSFNITLIPFANLFATYKGVYNSILAKQFRGLLSATRVLDLSSTQFGRWYVLDTYSAEETGEVLR